MTQPVTRPWSPVEVEVAMRRIIEELDDAVALQKALAETYAVKEHNYKLQQAKAWLLAAQDAGLKTDKLREAWVYTQLGDLRLERDIASGQLDAQKNVVKVLCTQADELRSLARSGRDMVEQPGWGTPRT